MKTTARRCSPLRVDPRRRGPSPCSAANGPMTITMLLVNTLEAAEAAARRMSR